MKPTGSTQGGCNRASNFQTCVKDCFGDVMGILLPWPDDFPFYMPYCKNLFSTSLKIFSTSASHTYFSSSYQNLYYTDQRSTAVAVLWKSHEYVCIPRTIAGWSIRRRLNFHTNCASISIVLTGCQRPYPDLGRKEPLSMQS